MLVKRYGKLVAVACIDLEVERAECFGLLEPNGAGKTTTLEVLEGLLTADDGAVEVLGTEYGGDDLALRERLGVGDRKFLFALVRRQARSFSFPPLWPSRVGDLGHDARVVATFGAAPGFRDAAAASWNRIMT